MGYLNPACPYSSYSQATRSAETLCAAYQRRHQTPVVIARLFDTFGPRMPFWSQYSQYKFHKNSDYNENILDNDNTFIGKCIRKVEY